MKNGAAHIEPSQSYSAFIQDKVRIPIDKHIWDEYVNPMIEAQVSRDTDKYKRLKHTLLRFADQSDILVPVTRELCTAIDKGESNPNRELISLVIEKNEFYTLRIV